MLSASNQCSVSVLELLKALVDREGGKIAVCKKCGIFFYTKEGRKSVCLGCLNGSSVSLNGLYRSCTVCGKKVAVKGGGGKFCYSCLMKRRKIRAKEKRKGE